MFACLQYATDIWEEMNETSVCAEIDLYTGGCVPDVCYI